MSACVSSPIMARTEHVQWLGVCPALTPPLVGHWPGLCQEKNTNINSTSKIRFNHNRPHPGSTVNRSASSLLAKTKKIATRVSRTPLGRYYSPMPPTLRGHVNQYTIARPASGVVDAGGRCHFILSFERSRNPIQGTPQVSEPTWSREGQINRVYVEYK